MTDKYLKISNKSGLVSRISLEKLGLSTKRNDPETIGRFGSGIKFAPIAALRKNLEWWFTGSDSNGLYKMQYRSEIEDGIECVVYDYGDYVKSSSFTIDAGVLSWVDCFQIYREAVSNAIDEAQSNDDWNISLVSADEISPVEGEFSVYITASPELMEINSNFDKYFCVNRDPVYTHNVGDIYSKIDAGLRLYTHGVLVHHDDSYFALYDYNLNDVKLNEERNISSIWDVEWTIARLLYSLNDPVIVSSIIHRVMFNDKLYFEIEKMSSSFAAYVDPSDTWKEVFEGIYGENCVIYDDAGEEFGVVNAIKLRGFNPVKVTNPNFYKFLCTAKIRSYVSILGEVYDVTIDHDYHKYPNLVTASRIAINYIPELSAIINSDRFGVFESKLERNLGLTLNMSKGDDEKKLLINKEHVNDNVEHILATIVHEYDHFATGISDNDYISFRDLADRRIAQLMINNYKPDFFAINDGVIEFPINRIGSYLQNMNFSITKISGFDGVVIVVGTRMVKVNEGVLYNGLPFDKSITGVLSPSIDGKSLVINGLTNVLEATYLG